jgi:transcription-repair coupling factor (superfamily II helicase)
VQAEEGVVLEALERELSRGGQCYCVVPRIADTEEVAALVHKLAPTARVMVANGQQACALKLRLYAALSYLCMRPALSY